MPDWLVERGIGETRAVRVKDGEIVDARIELDGIARAGESLSAKLKSAGKPAVAAADGCEYLLPAGATGVTEGAQFLIEVTREAIPGIEPWKRPLARAVERGPLHAPPLDGEDLPIPAARDALEQAGWSDLIEEARGGRVEFAGGSLGIFPTPAMTLIDVDGAMPPAELALAGAKAAASAIRRLDIGGSIGIDFPTVRGKTERQAIAAHIDAILPQPFERTAVNGFGFLHIVRPRRRASLIELAQDRPAFEARALLRRAAFTGPGPKRIVAHPAVVSAIQNNPLWIEGLARQAGGHIDLRADAALTMSGGHAESV